MENEFLFLFIVTYTIYGLLMTWNDVRKEMKEGK